ncbi:MAG: nucleoside triphosphate pyrophosphohydrolase [Chitinophagaceae bacterium]|nr:nucleoside triphosphate pyrophosphohydrolase [Chitinophagaceae bacterium]
MQEETKAFQKLLSLMKELREKCPWDKKQTFQSLRHYTIEETYELTDAILQENTTEIKKELGDLLFHIIFYAQIASETNTFDIAGVIEEVCEKLIKRHPHIYGNVTAKDEEEVKKNWEKIKLTEPNNTSVLKGVPKSLPSLIKATRMLDKVSSVGFETDNKDDIYKKIHTKIKEYQEILLDKKEIPDDTKTYLFGDLLFSLINSARLLKINPEEALEKANESFLNRFQAMELLIKNDNKEIPNLSVEELRYYSRQLLQL